MTSLTLSSALRVHPRVSIRPEPFGALLYHFGTRRLSFLKSRRLLAVVERLDDAATIGDALSASDVTTDEIPTYLNALSSLCASDMLEERTT